MIRNIRPASLTLNRILITALLLPLLALLAPHLAAGAVHVEWNYDSTVTDLAGFRLYLAGARVCETADPAARAIDCNAALAEGRNDFTMTAYTTAGVESSPSGVYAVDYTTPPPPAPANNPPVAYNESKTTPQTTTISGQMSATDPDGDPLSFLVGSYGSNFTEFTWQPNGSYLFTPDAAGTFSFTFTANDGQADSNPATVTITVTAVNHAPVAVNDNSVTDENRAVTVNVLANDSDADNDPLSITAVGQPAAGSALISNGSVVYTPALDYHGNDSFTYTVADGKGGTANATVAILVNKVNVAPSANNGNLVNVRGEASTGLATAVDPDNDPLTYLTVTPPAMGAVQMDSTTGQFIYTANLSASGTDSFSFKVNDGNIDSNPAVVTVTIVRPEDVITREFGSAKNADYPGTLKDTYLNLDNAANNGGSALSTWSWSGQAPYLPANTTVMKASLDVIPGSAIVTGARLYLFQTDALGAATYKNSVHMINGQTPVIGEATGYQAAAGVLWTAVDQGTTYNDIPLGLGDIGAATDTVALDSNTGYKSWDVTAMVQAWINNPAENKGLLLKAAEATAIETGRQFAAAEHPDATMRPRLVISYAPNTVNGNYPPTAAIVTTLIDAKTMSYAFDGRNSTDQDGRVIDYAWNFGDGQRAFGSYIEHAYAAAGNYTLTLTVMDDEGATASIQKTISVTAPSTTTSTKNGGWSTIKRGRK